MQGKAPYFDKGTVVYKNLNVISGSPDFSSEAKATYLAKNASLSKGPHLIVEEDCVLTACSKTKAYGIDVRGEGSALDLYGTLRISTENGAAITGNGSEGEGGTVINIHPSAVVDGGAAGFGIFHPQEGELNVLGGAIAGATGIEMRSGMLSVSGEALVTGTASSLDVNPNSNGATTVGAGIAVAQHVTKHPISVTVSNGTISGYAALYESNPEKNLSDDLARITLSVTGGTFNGSVTNHGTIAGGTFLSDVTNRGVIEGGIFENVISDQGGTVTSCAYPLRANLTGLSIAAVPSAMPKNTAAGFPAEPSAALTAAFEKDGADANLYQLSANEGYLLPDAIDVRCGAADGQTLALAAGTDYTYDPATGAIAIKKSVVTGPLLLAAQGAAAPTPPVPPTPDTPAPAPEPETPAPKPESKPDAPKPLPSTTDSKQAPANAAALAATGDAPLPQIALGIALLAGGVTLTCAIAMQITRKKRSNRS